MKMGVLEMWTIYERPADYPDKCVARKWEVGTDGLARTDEVRTATTLGVIRMEFEARGLFCLPRMPGDEPQIVETWF